ncbi:MAG: acyltransferase family protein [Colwellia sp.]|nr:acyltransferase family protein [Colwellia sp.]
MTRANNSKLSLLSENSTKIRYHYLDNIRALAMLLGIMFHAALAYSPLMQGFWFTADTDSSVTIEIVTLFTHLFRMPTFFLVSGFFAIMLIQKRGLTGFIKNRAIRILLPFLIFFPLLAAAIFMAINWAVSHVENLSPLLVFIKTLIENPDAKQPPLSTMHLWFLFNLFLFVLSTAALYKLKFFQSKIIDKISSTRFVVFVLPILISPAMFIQSAPHAAPDKFYPELWSFGFYGLFFILGALIFLKQSLLDEFEPYKNKFLAISLLAFTVFYYFLPATVSIEEAMAIAMDGFTPTLSHLSAAICEAFIAVYMTIYCLLLGKKYLNKQSKLLRFISDSSYWVYLIHMPILLMIQFALTDIDMNMWLKFLLSSLATLFITMLSYLILVKGTPIGWLLNGRKKQVLAS